MSPRPNIALVPIQGDLDVTSVDVVRDTLHRLADEGCRRIVLNMAGVSYVDSAGMGLLFSAVRRMRAMGGLISFVNVSEPVLAIMRRACLVDFAPVSGDAKKFQQEKPLDPTARPLWRSVVPIDCANLSATRSCVGRLIDRSNLSSDEAFDAKLAAGEAMGNVVDHAAGPDALVTVTGYDDRVIMEIADRGPGFNPATVCNRPKDCYAERGRGIMLMRLLADAVTIEPRSSGQGTKVRIVKMAHGAQ